MKKIMNFGLMVACCLALSACGSTSKPSDESIEKQETVNEKQENVQEENNSSSNVSDENAGAEQDGVDVIGEQLKKRAYDEMTKYFTEKATIETAIPAGYYCRGRLEGEGVLLPCDLDIYLNEGVHMEFTGFVEEKTTVNKGYYRFNYDVNGETMIERYKRLYDVDFLSDDSYEVYLYPEEMTYYSVVSAKYAQKVPYKLCVQYYLAPDQEWHILQAILDMDNLFREGNFKQNE